MLRRWALFGVVFISLGLPLAYFVVTAEDQKPWLIAFAAYFVVASVVGNLFVFFGGPKKPR